MSAWPRERIVVGLAPDQLSALRLGGWLRPRLLDRHTLALPAAEGSHWDKALAALETLLAESSWRDRPTTVILSSHFVRHAMLPPGPGLADAERQTLAQVLFHETFGDLARDWELRISPPARGKPTVACGVPRQLLNSLRAVCERKAPLSSIQPSLMPVFNRARRKFGKADGCLAMVEPGRITLAGLSNGQWQFIDSRAGGGDSLPQFLLEAERLHGWQPGGILWLSDLAQIARMPPGTDWSHQHIEPPRLAGIEGIQTLAGWGVA